MNYRVRKILGSPRRIVPSPIVVMDTARLASYVREFTADETQSTRQSWKQLASLKTLVDADSSYTVEHLQYYHHLRTGKRKMNYLTVKNDVIRYANAVKKQQRRITQNLIAESITGADWYEQTLALTKQSHRAVFMVAEDPRADFLQQGIIDRWIVNTIPIFLTLNRVAVELGEGRRELNGRLLLVSDALAENAIGSFENYRLSYALSHGVRRGRRRLQGGESCHDSGDRKGCVELASKGYQPIWAVTPIGQAACYHKCRCILEYRDEYE